MEAINTQNERQGLPSASALWLVARCPGSWSLGQQVEREVSEAMRDGIETHARIEALLRGEQYEGRPREEATAEQRARAELIIAKKAEEAVQALQRVLERNQMQHATQWVVETRYWIYWQDRKIGSAKPDYICLDPRTGRLLVVDFKTVSNPHASMLEDIEETADTSLQMWAGVTAWISEAEKGDLNQVKEVKQCYIKVPLWSEDAPIFVQESQWFDQTTIRRRYHEVVALCLAATDKSPTYIPGSHCKWCQANTICNRRMLPVLIGMSAQAAKSAMRLEPALAALVMAYKGELEALMDGAKEILLSLPDQQLDIYGWRKALPTQKDQITNALAAFQLLRDAGVPENTLLESCSMSMKSLTESIALQQGISVGEARDWLKSILGDYVETTTTAPRLVRVKGATKPELEPEPMEELL
jgi:hypothetical protein